MGGGFTGLSRYANDVSIGLHVVRGVETNMVLPGYHSDTTYVTTINVVTGMINDMAGDT